MLRDYVPVVVVFKWPVVVVFKFQIHVVFIAVVMVLCVIVQILIISLICFMLISPMLWQFEFQSNFCVTVYPVDIFRYNDLLDECCGASRYNNFINACCNAIYVICGDLLKFLVSGHDCHETRSHRTDS